MLAKRPRLDRCLYGVNRSKVSGPVDIICRGHIGKALRAMRLHIVRDKYAKEGKQHKTLVSLQYLREVCVY